MSSRPSSGFALLLVLWTLAVLSALALSIAADVGSEVRISQDSWMELQAERLAGSGHEFAAYLETRGIATQAEDLTGLPVEIVLKGLTYRVNLDIGSIDLRYEGENRKIDLAASNEEMISSLFGKWTADFDRTRQIAASIADWVDSDDEQRLFGAESAAYSAQGYSVRNAVLGAADLFLIQGLVPADFAPAIVQSDVRRPISWFLASTPTGRRMNPNYTSDSVLRFIPGMTESTLKMILELRAQAIFTNVEDFRDRMGIPADSPLLNYLAFDRGVAPALLSVARLAGSTIVRTERRVRRPSGGIRGSMVLWLVERNIDN